MARRTERKLSGSQRLLDPGTARLKNLSEPTSFAARGGAQDSVRSSFSPSIGDHFASNSTRTRGSYGSFDLLSPKHCHELTQVPVHLAQTMRLLQACASKTPAGAHHRSRCVPPSDAAQAQPCAAERHPPGALGHPDPSFPLSLLLSLKSRCADPSRPGKIPM
jgi:hypothetical protein